MQSALLRTVLLVGVAIGAFPAFAQQTLASVRKLDWVACVELVSKDNQELNAGRANLKASESQEGVYEAAMWPRLAGRLTAQENGSQVTGETTGTTYGASLTLSQNLFSGLADLARVRGAKADTRGSEADLVILKARLSADLKQAFEGDVYAREFVSLAEKILQRRDENKRIVELRFQGGRENKGSVLLSQAYSKQASYDLMLAHRQIGTARAQMLQVLGLTEREELELTGTVPKKDPSGQEPDFQAIARATPDYAKVAAQEESALHSYEAARAGFFPTLDLSGSYNRVDDKFFPDAPTDRWNVGLTLTIPLFEGGGTVSSTRASTARWESASQTRSAREKQVIVALRQSYSDYVISVEKEKVDESFRVAAEVRAEIARSKYNNGLMSFEEWDQVETDLITRQKAALNSRRQRVVDEAGWEQSQGLGVIP